MTTIKTITTSNVSGIKVGDLATITGKNGFRTEMGISQLIANAYITPDSNIVLTIENLDNLLDDNFNKHVLDVNEDPFFQGLKGLSYITIPIKEKANSGSLLGFVGHNPVLTDFSANVKSFSEGNNTVTIENTTTGSLNLSDVLPDLPFNIKIAQILDPRTTVNNSIFVLGSSGAHNTIIPLDTITTATLYEANVGIPSRKKEYLDVYLDGIKKASSDFQYAQGSGTDNIAIQLTGSEQELRITTNYYTVPAIEIGDNVATLSENTYSIIETSYSPSSANYNVAATSNSVFKVKIAETLKANLQGAIGVNISKDIIGDITSVTGNTFTLSYDESIYPGKFELANNEIYNVVAPVSFNKISLNDDRILRNVPEGLNVIRARNFNTSGRRSQWATSSTNISQLPIQRVENLTLTENLYLDTTQGASVSLEIAFDHIVNQEVTDYEISYKILDESGTTSGFSAVKAPVSGLNTTSGRMTYTINNIARGRTSAVNSVIVRVTPLNGDIRGVLTEKTQAIIGKSASPLTVVNLNGGQNGKNLSFSWDFPRNSDGSVIDIDLLETTIKIAPGPLTASEVDSAWISAARLLSVATPASSITFNISSYGDFTYLFKTVDTSKNESSDVAYLNITTIRPSNIVPFKVYSEDTPSANDVISGSTNNNYAEVNFTSQADSNNFGFATPWTSATDNANGTAVGYSFSGANDLVALSSALYQTKIRDAGKVITGQVLNTITGSSTLTTTYNDLHVDLVNPIIQESIWDIEDWGSINVIASSNTSDGLISETSNVTLLDYGSLSGPFNTEFVYTGGGGLGSMLGLNNVNAAPASYDSVNKTLISGGASGNVFAIWHEGNFVGDVANSNSFVLIAGIIDENTVSLGQSYYANGNPTGSNIAANINTTGSVVELVDLQQYSDPSGQLTFLGQDSVLSFNTEMRWSTASSVFYANGNVNVASWTSSNVNQGWVPYDSSQKTFRYFQTKHTVTNINPNLSDYILDVYNYDIELPSKIFTTTANTGLIHPTIIDYSNTGYTQNPTVTLTSLNGIIGNPVVISENTNNVSINVYSNTGTILNNVEVSVHVIGA